MPDEERWNTGWLGRPGASDMREPDVERAWLLVKGCWRFDIEFERFIAELGMGIAEPALWLMPPSVCHIDVC